MIKGLAAVGFRCKKPRETFNVWLDCRENSMKFTSKLLEKGVVVTPGIGFGSCGSHYVRFSLTRPKEEIEEACEKISTP